MNPNNRKFILLSALSLVGVVLVATSPSMPRFFGLASTSTQPSYGLSLDSSNAYNGINTKTVTSDSGYGLVDFAYDKASVHAGAHCALASGGSVRNTIQITSITSFTVTFDGSLRACLSYDGSSYAEPFTLGSGVTVSTGSMPYFVKLEAVDATILYSVDFVYSCSVNPDAVPVESDPYLAGMDFYDSSKLSDNNAQALVTTQLINSALVSEPTRGDTPSVCTGVSTTSVYYGRYGGIGLGSSKSAGILTIDIAESYRPTRVVVWAAGYGKANVNLQLNDVDRTLERQYSSSSWTYNEVEWNFDEPQESLTFISGNDKNRIALYAIYLYSGAASSMPTPTNPSAFEIGFQSSISKTSYKGADTFDPSTLTVSAAYSDASSAAAIGYTYTVAYADTGVAIDHTKAFKDNAGYNPEGTNYNVTVSYGNYIPQIHQISVSTDPVITSVSLDLNKLSYYTYESFSTSSVSFDVHYDQTSHNVTGCGYEDLAEYGLHLDIIKPNLSSYTLGQAFGSAGTYTAKLSLIGNPSISDTIDFTVNAVAVASVSLDHAELEIELGHEAQLAATVTPNNATDPSISWTSSNPSVATVNSSGLVSSLSIGTATITATSNDNQTVFGSCDVTVIEAALSPDVGAFTLSSSSTLTVGSYVIFASGYEGSIKAMGTTQNSNNRPAVDAEVNNGIIHRDSNATYAAFRVEEGTVADTYSFYDEVNQGYLFAASSSYNWLRVEAEKSANSSFTISGAESKTIAAQGSNSRNLLRYNSNSKIFSCYGSGQAAPYIYEKAGDPVYPTSISVTASSHNVGVGRTLTITLSFEPDNATMTSVTWASSNDLVASVNDGIVTGIKAGSTNITATVKDHDGNDLVAEWAVTVSNVAVTSVSLNKTALSLGVGEEETLLASILPEDATNTDVNWSTSDNGVATVSDGKVTAIDPGTADITVTTVDGNKTATCKVTVTGSGSSTGTIDVINNAATSSKLGNTATSSWASDFSLALSGATYYIHSMGTKNGSHALQWNTNGYLYTTVSSGTISSISVAMTSGKSIEVFGSNTAFSGNSGGTSLGTMQNGNTLTPSGSYSYLRIIGKASSTQITSLTITYGETPKIDPTAISIESAVSLTAGASKTLGVTYTPENANQNKGVTWTSSNASVATVDSSGKVTVASNATANQTATITAKLNYDNSISASCVVTVIDKPIAAQTILIYMCGSNLESGSGLATGDIDEILKISGQPDDVNIVIETGGAKSWKKYGISASYLQRYHVKNRSLVLDDSITKASMGKASTLQSFIEYGLNNFEATRTGLVFWNHGGAMDGCCFDENANDDSLTNDEVKSALSGAFSATGRVVDQDHLEWVGYDACLMAVQDIAEFNSHYFNYMVSSQETEGGYGWDYDGGNWLKNLYSNPSTYSTETMLKAICSSFIADNSSESTLSALDLSKMSAYKTAFEAMATKLSAIINSSSKWTTFKNLVNQCKKYGYYADYSQYNGGYVYDVFDAKDLITKMQNNSTYNGSMSSELNTLLTAFNNLVIESKYTSDYAGSHGLNFFCPLCGFNSKSCYSTSMTNFTNWRSICIDYGSWYQ